jgi:hypothetical protein
MNERAATGEACRRHWAWSSLRSGTCTPQVQDAVEVGDLGSRRHGDRYRGGLLNWTAVHTVEVTKQIAPT